MFQYNGMSHYNVWLSDDCENMKQVIEWQLQNYNYPMVYSSVEII